MRLISVLGVVLLSLSMLSCEGLLGPDGGQVHQRVQVSMSVRKPVPAALINGLAVTGPSQFGTSLIVLVPEGTESTPFFEQIAGVDVLDRQLLDLATSSVSLGVPLGVPVQLFEYTFNDTLTLEEILAGSPIAGSPNVTAAFTLGPEIFDETTGEASFSVLLSLRTTSILESFDAALSDLLWERVDSGRRRERGRAQPYHQRDL